MHFDFLIEDQSGERMLERLLPKILQDKHTFLVKSYKGTGHLPKDLKPSLDPSKRVLLGQLPRLIQGYGKTYEGYGDHYQATLIIVIDLDDRNFSVFLSELNDVYMSCSPKPTTYFCLAIEEGEAWFLGDINAIISAYPSSKKAILDTYIPDSICDTWELLADAIYPGGLLALKKKGKGEIGKEKSEWALNITPHMNINTNKSQSFCFFRNTIFKCIED